MREIEPDMVLGKEVVDGDGGSLGEIVDVGLYTHDRVKFLVVQDRARRVPIRRVGVDAIASVSPDTVRLSVL
jgi:hypothetical protein